MSRKPPATRNEILYIFQHNNDPSYFPLGQDMDLVRPIRIGITKNLDQRIRTHRTSLPFHEQLLLSVPCSRSEERLIHQLLAQYSTTGGEWYHPHPTVRWFVHTVADEWVTCAALKADVAHIVEIVAFAQNQKTDPPPLSLITHKLMKG